MKKLYFFTKEPIYGAFYDILVVDIGTKERKDSHLLIRAVLSVHPHADSLD